MLHIHRAGGWVKVFHAATTRSPTILTCRCVSDADRVFSYYSARRLQRHTGWSSNDSLHRFQSAMNAASGNSVDTTRYGHISRLLAGFVQLRVPGHSCTCSFRLFNGLLVCLQKTLSIPLLQKALPASCKASRQQRQIQNHSSETASMPNTNPECSSAMMKLALLALAWKLS